MLYLMFHHLLLLRTHHSYSKHYSENNITELMHSLFQQLNRVLSYFENYELAQFDAQVGETLCQILYLATYSPISF